MSMDVVSQVQSLERKGDKVVVEVAALGPVNLEDLTKQRARARALMVAGVLPTTFDTVKDIPMGEIQRLTEITGDRSGEDVTFDSIPVLGKLLQKRIYTIEVNRD